MASIHSAYRRRARVLTILSVTAALFLVLALPTTALAVGGWFEQSSGTTNELDDVSFADAAHGWAVGQGIILATSDGGTTWANETPALAAGTSMSLTAVAAPDAMHCWAVGTLSTEAADGGGVRGIVLATTDGGVTWLEQDTHTTAYLQDVSFPNASDGWVVGYTTILHTTDGGSTWAAETYGPNGGCFSVSFANASDGWVVGNGSEAQSLVLATTNGGKTWASQSVDDYAVNKVVSASATEAWAVTTDELLTTRDGGVAWNTVDSSALEFGGFVDASFRTPAVGWVVDDTGSVYATNDAGATWITQPTIWDGYVFAAATSLSFPDTKHGWFVTSDGSIFATTSGGYVAPRIRRISTYAAPAGTPVTISGSDFGGVTAVRFNGHPVKFGVNDDEDTIKTIVPRGATSGSITVTTPGGTAVSVKRFTVLKDSLAGSWLAGGSWGISMRIGKLTLTSAYGVHRVTWTYKSSGHKYSQKLNVRWSGGLWHYKNIFVLKPSGTRTMKVTWMDPLDHYHTARFHRI